MFTDIVAIILVVFSFGMSVLLFAGSAIATWRKASEYSMLAGLGGAVVAAMGIVISGSQLPRSELAHSALIIPWKDFLRLNSMIGAYLLVANLLAMVSAMAMDQRFKIEGK